VADDRIIYPLRPSDKPLTLNRWTDVELVLTWRQSKDGPLLDLTGYTFTLKAYQEFSKTAPVAFEIPVTVDYVASTTTLAVASSALQQVELGEYKFRLVGTRAGKKRTFWRASITIED
jgi:hypothetical protein